MPVSHSLDAIVVDADDDHAVANAGLILAATLAQRLDLEALVNDAVDLGDRPGHFLPGRKVMTLVHAMVAGGDVIDDTDILRSGSTGGVVGHRVMAPSTCGTFLRSCSFGHVRQLDKVAEAALGGAWAAGAGPGGAAMTIDLDSTICEVYGKTKQGAAYGHSRQLGYHPLVATRADTGEVLHTRMRKGSAHTARGAERFVTETVGRVRRAGASGPLVLRADSGFWSNKVRLTCRRHQVRYSLTVRQIPAIKAAIAAIDEDSWVDIDYPDGGIAQVAEGVYGDDRLIVRRSRLVGAQAALWPDWRHHGFVTNRDGDTIELEADHRRHAVVELAIRELKAEALAHCPSGKFSANAAWLVIAALAHNLIRWVARLALGVTGTLVTKTLRRRYINLPGRFTRSARKRHLHIPRHWPWATQFLIALRRLRQIPPRT
jgi:hypothetical protein